MTDARGGDLALVQAPDAPYSEDRFWSGQLQPLLERGVTITEEYRGLRSTLVADQDLDYLRFDAVPDPAVLDHFYNHVYPVARRSTWYNVRAQYDPERWSGLVDSVARLAAEQGLTPDEVRVHDVGCGFGGLVHELRKRGFQASGTDLCEEAVDGGRRDGGNEWVFAKTAQDYLGEAGPHHVIVMNHMIEHVADPLPLVRELVQFLEPGGSLVVRCPNSQYVRSRVETMRASWFGFPKHLHYFGPRSLSHLLRLAGLERVEVSCTDTEVTGRGELEAIRRGDLAGEYPVDDDELIAWLRAHLASKELEGVGRRH